MNTELLLTRSLRAAAALLIAGWFAAGLAACGGSDDAGANPNPNAGASASIGAAGGTLSGPSGAQLVVPAGALAQATTVTIAQDGAGAPA